MSVKTAVRIFSQYFLAISRSPVGIVQKKTESRTYDCSVTYCFVALLKIVIDFPGAGLKTTNRNRLVNNSYVSESN